MLGTIEESKTVGDDAREVSAAELACQLNQLLDINERTPNLAAQKIVTFLSRELDSLKSVRHSYLQSHVEMVQQAIITSKRFGRSQPVSWILLIKELHDQIKPGNFKSPSDRTKARSLKIKLNELAMTALQDASKLGTRMYSDQAFTELNSTLARRNVTLEDELRQVKAELKTATQKQAEHDIAMVKLTAEKDALTTQVAMLMTMRTQPQTSPSAPHSNGSKQKPSPGHETKGADDDGSVDSAATAMTSRFYKQRKSPSGFTFTDLNTQQKQLAMLEKFLSWPRVLALKIILQHARIIVPNERLNEVIEPGPQAHVSPAVDDTLLNAVKILLFRERRNSESKGIVIFNISEVISFLTKSGHGTLAAGLNQALEAEAENRSISDWKTVPESTLELPVRDVESKPDQYIMESANEACTLANCKNLKAFYKCLAQLTQPVGNAKKNQFILCPTILPKNREWYDRLSKRYSSVRALEKKSIPRQGDGPQASRRTGSAPRI